MNLFLNTFSHSSTSVHLTLRGDDVAAIDWQKQHYLNNQHGVVLKELSDALDPARTARTPFTLRVEHADHHGPYHITPLWNARARTLTLSLTHSAVSDRNEAPLMQITLYASHIARECSDYSAYCLRPGGVNAAIRIKNTAGALIRERLSEQHVTISDRFAGALFTAIATLVALGKQFDA
jgi:hypothetical protein